MIRQSLKAVPLPIVLVLVSFICPTELSLFVGGMRLSPHRVAFVLLIPFALVRLFQRKDVKIQAFDIMFTLYNVWTVSIFLYHGDSAVASASGSNAGSGGALNYGGSLALESFGGYIIARAYIRNWASCAAVIRLLVVSVGLVALLALPEALSGQHLVHDFLNSLTGYNFPLKYEQRLGLERAYSVFDHPIHYGTFCASALAMIWYSERRTLARWKKILLIAAATLLGLSSAPILCMALQIGLILWDKATRGVDNRLTITFSAFVALYIGTILLGTRTPANFIATGMTLDSWTGYYRLVIWEAGIENIQASPLTGIGLGDWVRPWWMASDSVDAFWLLIPLRAGMPAVILLLLAIAMLFRRVAVRGHRHPEPEARQFQLGWSMSVIALCLIGCTVHYWNVPYAYLFFILGLGGWLADPAPLRAGARAQAMPDQAKDVPARRTGRVRPKPHVPLRPVYQRRRDARA